MYITVTQPCCDSRKLVGWSIVQKKGKIVMPEALSFSDMGKCYNDDL